MLNNWYKKEKPFIGFAGFGGGATGLAFGGGAEGDKIAASGGVIADYVDGSSKYRAHIFTNSGSLNISSATPDATIEYLVVGGGGGGGYTFQVYTCGGGGGAGGLRTNVPGVQDAGGNPLTADPYPVSAGVYAVVVGDGGLQGNTDSQRGVNGTDSAFYPPAHATYPAVQYIRGAGGGGGGNAMPPSGPLALGLQGNTGGGSGGVGTYPNCPSDGYGGNGLANTGGGGGAGSGGCPEQYNGGGGSGIVLIAYPT